MIATVIRSSAIVKPPFLRFPRNIILFCFSFSYLLIFLNSYRPNIIHISSEAGTIRPGYC